MIRALCWLWLSVMVLCGVVFFIGGELEHVYGHVDPALGTDGPQFAQWLEGHDE